jgi:hypothetical protein
MSSLPCHNLSPRVGSLFFPPHHISSISTLRWPIPSFGSPIKEWIDYNLVGVGSGHLTLFRVTVEISSQTLPPPPLFSSHLSPAPFPALEAALKLVHAFGECGTQYQSLVVEGVFPGIVEALHQVRLF